MQVPEQPASRPWSDIQERIWISWLNNVARLGLYGRCDTADDVAQNRIWIRNIYRSARAAGRTGEDRSGGHPDVIRAIQRSRSCSCRMWGRPFLIATPSYALHLRRRDCVHRGLDPAKDLHDPYRSVRRGGHDRADA